MSAQASEDSVNKPGVALRLAIALVASGGACCAVMADPAAATVAPVPVAAPAPASAPAPAPAIAEAPCQRASGDAHNYLADTQVDAMALIGPPPAVDSAAQRADLQAVLAAQHRARAEHSLARAIADAEISCARVAAAAGEFHDQAAAASALAFLDRAALQGARFTGPAKRYWHRARPYLVSAKVERLGDVAPNAPLPENPGGSAAYREQRDHTGYPSGHAAFGLSCAILLARMVPERSRELYQRGLLFGDSRVAIGAHFPSDVVAGRMIAVATTALLQANPCFEADFAPARSSLRQALGLPAALPPRPETAP